MSGLGILWGNGVWLYRRPLIYIYIYIWNRKEPREAERKGWKSPKSTSIATCRRKKTDVCPHRIRSCTPAIKAQYLFYPSANLRPSTKYLLKEHKKWKVLLFILYDKLLKSAFDYKKINLIMWTLSKYIYHPRSWVLCQLGPSGMF